MTETELIQAFYEDISPKTSGMTLKRLLDDYAQISSTHCARSIIKHMPEPMQSRFMEDFMLYSSDTIDDSLKPRDIFYKVPWRGIRGDFWEKCKHYIDGYLKECPEWVW